MSSRGTLPLLSRKPATLPDGSCCFFSTIPDGSLVHQPLEMAGFRKGWFDVGRIGVSTPLCVCVCLSGCPRDRPS